MTLDRDTLVWCLALVQRKSIEVHDDAERAMNDWDEDLAEQLEMAESYLDSVAEDINAEITETY